MVVADTVTEKLETEKEQEAPFDLEKAFSAEDTHLQNIAAVSAERVEKSANDFTHTKDILDKTLKEFASGTNSATSVESKSKVRSAV